MTAFADQPGSDVTVSPQGRVTIPAAIRQAAGISPGATLHMSLRDGAIVLEGRANAIRRLRETIAAQWTPNVDLPDDTGLASDELIADRREDAAREAGAA